MRSLRGVISTKERWKPIKGYKGLYSVSTRGRVYSHERVVAYGNGVRTIRPKILKTSLNTHGYPYVSLHRDGTRVCRTVHRLVARAFHGKCPEGMEVRHKDGNRQNPRLKNLVYGTRQENMADRYDHGTDQNGERGPGAVDLETGETNQSSLRHRSLVPTRLGRSLWGQQGGDKPHHS